MSTAPVSTTRSIHVPATPEVVWAVLAAFDRWPEWNDDVEWVRLEGPILAGATFRWKSGPGSIHATIVSLEPPTHLALTGTTFGIHASHDWRIEPEEARYSLVVTEESWTGLLARMLRRPLQGRLERRIDQRLRHLAAEAGRRTATGSSTVELPGRTDATADGYRPDGTS